MIESSEGDLGVETSERHWTALVDKRIPLSEFKVELQKLLAVPSDYLLVYKRISSSSSSVSASATVSTSIPSEREWLQPSETLETLGDDPHVCLITLPYLRNGIHLSILRL